MSRFRLAILAMAWLSLIPPAHADQVTFAYEGDVLPSDPTSGLEVYNPCDQACSETIQNGFLTLSWTGPGIGDRHVNFTRNFGPYPSDPPPLPFWIEWRFASNFPLGPTSFDLDGAMVILSDPISTYLNMYGDAIISEDASQYVLHLALNEFRTFRFETQDGLNFCVWYDGNLFACDVDGINAPGIHYLQLYGLGGDNPNFSWPGIDRWDYVRYGQMTTGEAIVSSDPPSGSVGVVQYPNFDRFTVTFDQPNYVHVDEVTVQVSSGVAPQVIKTRRRDNGPPETVEIVLDRPLALGVTTTFTFATGGLPNSVTYTLVQTGACCQPNGTCTDSTESDCASAQGAFVAGGSCSTPSACCLSGGSCQNLTAACCSLSGGTANSSGACEGDADHDGIDGMCGDECPADPMKTSPGVCGCGVSDVDSDSDGVPDCIDLCPTLNPDDANHNGIPDCQEPISIPTTTQWGLTILALMILSLAKVYSLRSVKRLVS